MNHKVWRIVAVSAVAVILTACGSLGAAPTLATSSERALLGGGGIATAPVSDQVAQGLVVGGIGRASSEPEVAQITFGVELRGDDPAALVDEGSQKINRAIEAVKSLGVAEEDIKTVGYNLWVENIYDPERGVPTGEVVYHLSHTIQARLTDMLKVGDLLAAAVNAGANTISGVSFTVEEPGALTEEARRLALRDAAAQAASMADELGITLGKPILVMETSGDYPVQLDRGLGGGGAVEAAAPSISPGSFSVSVSVRVVYEIN
ncbi:MAG: SIMPL domain-containing protein [Chloroflexi bacterium]|nr:SIMPL domain-containing protein [Chloroflexota bacterium]